MAVMLSELKNDPRKYRLDKVFLNGSGYLPVPTGRVKVPGNRGWWSPF